MTCVQHFIMFSLWKLKLTLEFISSKGDALVPGILLRSVLVDRTCIQSWNLVCHLLPFLFSPVLIKAFIDGEIIGPRMILDNVWKEHLNSLLYGAFELINKKRIAITLHATTKFLFGNCLKEFNSEDTKISVESQFDDNLSFALKKKSGLLQLSLHYIFYFCRKEYYTLSILLEF